MRFDREAFARACEDAATAAERCRLAAPGSDWPRWIETPAPWWPIVESFAQGVNRSGLAIAVSQVKEKFGGLVIHYGLKPDGGHHPRIDALVDAAEDAASCTCEGCGARGQLDNVGNWLRVVCFACRKKFAPPPEGRDLWPEDR